MSLAHDRFSRSVDLGRVYAQKLAAGVQHGDKTYQIDEGSQSRITAMAARALAVMQGVAGATWPEGFSWIAANNTTQGMTAAEMFAFAQAASDRVVSLRLAFRSKKDEIAALGSSAAIREYDVNAGWP